MTTTTLVKRDFTYWAEHGSTPADIPAFLAKVRERTGVLYDLTAPGHSIPAAIEALNAQLEDLGGVKPEESDGFSYQLPAQLGLNEKDYFPPDRWHRWFACFAVRGGSEGYWAHIHLLGRGYDSHNRLLAFAKTYSAENAWLLARTAAILLDA